MGKFLTPAAAKLYGYQIEDSVKTVTRPVRITTRYTNGGAAAANGNGNGKPLNGPNGSYMLIPTQQQIEQLGWAAAWGPFLAADKLKPASDLTKVFKAGDVIQPVAPDISGLKYAEYLKGFAAGQAGKGLDFGGIKIGVNGITPPKLPSMDWDKITLYGVIGIVALFLLKGK